MAGTTDSMGRWQSVKVKASADNFKLATLLSSAVLKGDDGEVLTIAVPKGSGFIRSELEPGHEARTVLDNAVADAFGPRSINIIESPEVEYAPPKVQHAAEDGRSADAGTGQAEDHVEQTDEAADSHPSAAEDTAAGGRAVRGRFDHSELGDELMEGHHAGIADGIPVVWDAENRRYRAGQEALERAMISLRRNVTRSQRNEVFSYIAIQSEPMEMADPRLIAFSNGVLDLETMELREPSPDIVLPNVIPHRWNPDASSRVLDEAISAWACGDPGRMANIMEAIGLCMYRGRDVTACPVLVGRGSNGKSTMLNMLRKVLGPENVASLDLATIGRRFQSVALIGKLANIADDLPNSFVEGDSMATLKRAITGDAIPAEIKGGMTFSFRPYCRFVFSANEIPRMGDTSYGTYRRFVPIRFNARFSAQDGTASTHLEVELSTEAAYERAILLGVDALRDCIKRGYMTPTEDQREVLDDMRMQNSSVVTFVEDYLGGRDRLVFKITEHVFADYVKFCDEANMRPVSRNNFTAEAKATYDLDTMRKRVAGHQQAMFIERA